MSEPEAAALAEVLDKLGSIAQRFPNLEDFALSVIDDIWRQVFEAGLTPSRFLELAGIKP